MYYNAKNIPTTHKNLPLPIYKGINLDGFELYYDCETRNYDGAITHIINSYDTILAKEYKGILCILRNHKGKYYLHPEYKHENRVSFSYSIKKEALKDLKEPNYIGVFSPKKINDWLEYCYNYVRILQETEEKHKAKNDLIRQEIEDIHAMGKPNGSIQDTHTFTKVGKFEIEIIHDIKEAWLTKKIRFNGNVDDIKSLMA